MMVSVPVHGECGCGLGLRRLLLHSLLVALHVVGSSVLVVLGGMVGPNLCGLLASWLLGSQTPPTLFRYTHAHGHFNAHH